MPPIVPTAPPYAVVVGYEVPIVGAAMVVIGAAMVVTGAAMAGIDITGCCTWTALPSLLKTRLPLRARNPLHFSWSI